MTEEMSGSANDAALRAAASFRVRYAAYTADLALIAPIALLLSLGALGRARQALDELELAMMDAFERMAPEAMANGLALVSALRADAVFLDALTASSATIAGSVLQALLTAVLIAAVWFIGFEASRWQATPGKRVLGLRVEMLDGTRPSLARAALRFIAAGPSWLLLHLGHALVAFRADERAAHDLVAGTRVVRAAAPLPAWARAWLGLQIAAVAALLAWVAWTLARTVILLGL